MADDGAHIVKKQRVEGEIAVATEVDDEVVDLAGGAPQSTLSTVPGDENEIPYHKIHSSAYTLAHVLSRGLIASTMPVQVLRAVPTHCPRAGCCWLSHIMSASCVMVT